MTIVFTLESSSDTINKLRPLVEQQDLINGLLKPHDCGPDLQYLYIRILCLSERMENLFPPLPPRYYTKATNYMHRGERLEKPAATFEYDLRLDFEKYRVMDEVAPSFAGELLDTINIIQSDRRLKHIDLTSLKNSLRAALISAGWIKE